MNRRTTWRFFAGPLMDLSNRAGSLRGLQYRLYPDGRGRWFLVLPEGRPRSTETHQRVYWIEVGEDSIAVEQDLVAEEGFEAAFVLRRN